MLPKSKHPLFEIQVPSTKKKLKFRPLVVKEEKILLMAKESRDEMTILSAIKQVVNNCVVDKINIDEISIFDLEYLFLRLRAQSISNIAFIALVDKDDKVRRDFEVDLFKVEVKWPEKEYPNKVQFDDITITLKYPRAELYSRTDLLDDADTIGQNLIASCIDKIFQGDAIFDPKKEKKEEVLEFLDDLPVPVYKQIEDYISNPPMLYYKIEYKNAKGEDRSHELKTLDDFFTLR